MKNIILLAILICAITPCLAQNTPEDVRINKSMPKPVPLSPNAASFIKYGNYEVSHYTGLPEISIPLATATSGKISIPIFLRYHAGGIKYQDQASWVGLGWSIASGGQVSRQINGHPDGSYFLNNPVPQDIQVCRDAEYIKGIDNGMYDGEADLFSYNAPGLGGGKFVLGQNGQPPMFIPFSNVKLSYNINSYFQIADFKMTGSNGTIYKFTDAEVSNTWSEQNSNFLRGGTVTWNLTEIKDPNSDDMIKIKYQPLGSTLVEDYSEVWRITDKCGGVDPGWLSSCGGYDLVPFPHRKLLSASQSGIDVIEHEGGKIVFVKGPFRADQPQSNLLDKIDVYSLLNGQYKLLKTYDFVYSYYKSIAGNIDLRLKLDKLLVLDANGSMIEQHQFTYRTNTFSWDHPSSSKSIDYWGFFNGKPNQYLTPPITFDFVSGGVNVSYITLGNANRNSDTTLMKEGILERIDYPTGGYTKFHFSPHSYKRWDGTTGFGGGLRIRKIESFDGANITPSLIKTYKYGELEDGYGVPLFESEQLFGSYSLTTSNFSKIDATGQSVKRTRTIYSNPTMDWSGSDGSSVVYPYVTEYYLGHNEGNIGKIKYLYDNGSIKTDGIHSIGEGSGRYHKTQYNWQRGFLTKKTVFDKNGNYLQSTENQYQVLNEIHPFKSVGIYKLYEFDGLYPQTSCFNMPGYDENEFVASNLEIPSGVMMLLSSTETQCENGNPAKCISFGESYVYDNTYLQVMEKARDIGGSKSQVTKYKYPFNYSFTGAETGNALSVKKMKDMNSVSTPIEEYNIIREGSVNNVVGGQVTTYKVFPANSTYVTPDVSYQLESSVSIPEASYTTTSISGSAVNMDVRYKPAMNFFYDLSGNIIQVQQTNNNFIGYQWGYNNSLPIAEVSKAQNNYIGVTSNQTESQTVNTSTTASTTVTFTVDYPGDVILKLGTSGSLSYTTYVNYSGFRSGGFTLTGGQTCGYNQITLTNVTPNTYSLTIELSTSDPSAIEGACGELIYPKFVIIPTGIKEFFHENFEEGSATGVAIPHTGKKYLTGDYTCTYIMPNSRNYIVEYWYLNGVTWEYARAPYTNGMVLTLGSAIDNVRIYPTDALMKNYTYEPGLGISSVIDEKGAVMYYTYDSFGRLWQVKNYKGEIEKQYSYNYKK